MTKVPPPSYIYVQAIEALNAQSSIISQIQHDKIEKLFILKRRIAYLR
jgi:hypothetical protein